MSNDDNGKVVKLRQPQVNKPAAGVGVGASSSGASVDEAINPKSFMNMSDLEQDMFLQQLRERRMRVVEVLKAAKAAKSQATSIAAKVKLERKIDQLEKQLERTTKALDKLEELVYDVRALTLQHTDTDITRVADNVKITTDNGSKS